jgi:enolase
MIVPLKFKSFSDALRCGVEVYHSLKKVLKKEKLSVSVGDEGGFAPNLNSDEQAIEYIIKAIGNSGYKPGKEVFIALDVAASSFYEKGKYIFRGEQKNSNQLIDFYEKIISEYPIISIEDGLSEDDWEGWKIFTKRLGEKIQIVGDDLFVTNTERLKKGIKLNVANSILIKVNQIGTLTETLQAIDLARKHNYKTIISHRSGETEDTTISDIAVGTNSGQIKTGAPSRTERCAKYNQILRIEEDLGKQATYIGDI